MLRRLHRQMTFFCALVTSLILVGMTVVCLFIAENGTKERNYAAFSNNCATVAAYLENQTQISASWIRQIENAYHVQMDIRDNGQSLFSLKLLGDQEAFQTAFEKAREIAKEEFFLDSAGFEAGRSISGSCFFEMPGMDGVNYFASVLLIPKGSSVMDVTVLYSMEEMERSMLRQRVLFGLVDLAAIVLLGIFSWFFTARMIRPIRKSQERQAQFIAAASHELRSPLTVMLSSLSAMKRADRAQAEQFQDTIRSEGLRMSRLINDMLILANADNKSWSIHLKKLELDTLLLSVYEKYEYLAREKGFTLSIALPEEDCPPGFFDGERMEQVLSILIENAMSYAFSPGKIGLALSFDKRMYRLSVSDNGPGIPDEEKKAIFERFYRADHSHKDKSHFGLGLCIAAEIVKLHHGKIWVEDTPGGGATFLVSLPIQPAPGSPLSRK